MALVTVFSPLPNNAGSRRLPIDIRDELGSATPLATWAQDTGPEVLGTMSSIFRSAPESSDLLAKPPSIAAMDDSMPRATDVWGCPSALATSPTVCLSSMFSKEPNIESDISASFGLPSLGEILLALYYQ